MKKLKRNGRQNLRIQWTEKARTDLNHIEQFISEGNPVAALETIVKIITTVESSLSRHPGIGRPGRHPQTRELIISGTPYIVPYHASKDSIFILRVVHAAMQWPDNF